MSLPPRSTNWSIANCVASVMSRGWTTSSTFTSAGISVTFISSCFTSKSFFSSLMRYHAGC